MDIADIMAIMITAIIIADVVVGVDADTIATTHMNMTTITDTTHTCIGKG
jgi:hypothetical protein